MSSSFAHSSVQYQRWVEQYCGMDGTHKVPTAISYYFTLVLFGLLGSVGCSTPGRRDMDSRVREELVLVLPEKIEIVEAFSGLRDFDTDGVVDGLGVRLRPISPFGEPVRAVGRLRLELYDFLPASGEPKGTRRAQWHIPLDNAESQKAHWNRATQMYEFQLSADLPGARAEDRYVLEATFTDPLEIHSTAQHILQVPLNPRSLVRE